MVLHVKHKGAMYGWQSHCGAAVVRSTHRRVNDYTQVRVTGTGQYEGGKEQTLSNPLEQMLTAAPAACAVDEQTAQYYTPGSGRVGGV